MRRLFLWLLMLAIPVQGLAASTMLLCGPGHHGPMPHAMGAAAAGTHSAGSAGSARSADSTDCAHHTLEPEALTDANADSSASGTPQASKSKCSACASCCSALALLGAGPSVASSERHESRTAAIASPLEPVFVAGLEKPPRAGLA